MCENHLNKNSRMTNMEQYKKKKFTPDSNDRRNIPLFLMSSEIAMKKVNCHKRKSGQTPSEDDNT